MNHLDHCSFPLILNYSFRLEFVHSLDWMDGNCQIRNEQLESESESEMIHHGLCCCFDSNLDFGLNVVKMNVNALRLMDVEVIDLEGMHLILRFGDRK